MIYTLRLSKKCIKECSGAGDATQNVEFWLCQSRIRKQVDAIPADVVARHLKEFGAWDAEELNDRVQNEKRLLWTACGSACDAIHNKDSAPCTVYIDD